MAEPVAPDTASVGGDADGLETTFVRPQDGVVVLSVVGEVDTLTAPALTDALRRLTEAREPVLVVDLSAVRFLASSGLAVLIQTAHRAEERGARLRLVAANRAVRRPLEITGTDQLFDLHDELDTALPTAG